DSLPDISILAESVTKDPLVEETMWRERWELWFHELDQKAAAKYDAYITDIRSRKSRVEWEMRDRKSELEIREDDIKRLRDLVKSWDRMKKAAQEDEKCPKEPWEIYGQHPFSDLVEKNDQYGLFSRDEKVRYVAKMEESMATRINRLEWDVDILRQRVVADGRACELDLDDEEFLDIISVPPADREA